MEGVVLRHKNETAWSVLPVVWLCKRLRCGYRRPLTGRACLLSERTAVSAPSDRRRLLKAAPARPNRRAMAAFTALHGLDAGSPTCASQAVSMDDDGEDGAFSPEEVKAIVTKVRRAAFAARDRRRGLSSARRAVAPPCAGPALLVAEA